MYGCRQLVDSKQASCDRRASLLRSADLTAAKAVARLALRADRLGPGDRVVHRALQIHSFFRRLRTSFGGWAVIATVRARAGAGERDLAMGRLSDPKSR